MNSPDIANALVIDPALIWLVRLFGLAGLAAIGVWAVDQARLLTRHRRDET